MKQAEYLEEVKMRRFSEVYLKWHGGELSQAEAAEVLGVCSRTFRRYIPRYEEEGLEGLYDRRMRQESSRKAPVDEALALVDNYNRRYEGWNVTHYYNRVYRPEGGKRSYNWVRKTLLCHKAIPRVTRGGTHRKRREPSAMPGMILHQDGSRHEWVPGRSWDLIVTMDDATNEHYSMFFCKEEGTASSFRGVRETIEAQGLFSSFYTDRGSHYWHTPKADGEVDKTNPTQFGRAMQQLGIQMIPAYSPEARGRSERAFRTHQDRLVKELALEGITDMEAANEYIRTTYLPNHNAEFKRPAREEGMAFVPLPEMCDLDNILCKQYERKVRLDNCIQFKKLLLQIPADRHRHHYVKAKVKVLVHMDDTLSVFHGPRLLARYESDGTLIGETMDVAA